MGINNDGYMVLHLALSMFHQYGTVTHAHDPFLIRVLVSELIKKQPVQLIIFWVGYEDL